MNNPGPILQTAILLLNGWGYNLYREENRLRADDLLIRSNVGAILSQARVALRALEDEFRRVYLPAPTRDNPFPDKQKTAQVRLIGRCDVLIEQLATAISSAPAPTNDGAWRHHYSEREILQRLQELDVQMVDAVIAFHDHVVVLDLAGVSDGRLEADIQARLAPLKLLVQERAERLRTISRNPGAGDY